MARRPVTTKTLLHSFSPEVQPQLFLFRSLALLLSLNHTHSLFHFLSPSFYQPSLSLSLSLFFISVCHQRLHYLPSLHFPGSTFLSLVQVNFHPPTGKQGRLDLRTGTKMMFFKCKAMLFLQHSISSLRISAIHRFLIL